MGMLQAWQRLKDGERKQEETAMDLVEAISQRRSIRAFKPDPVPKSVLSEILELALRAPSWANTQPWEFAVVGGETLDELRQAFLEREVQGSDADLPGPREFPEPFKRRRGGLFTEVARVMGMMKDAAQGGWWQSQGLRLYGAPAAIFIYTDRSFYFQGDTTNVWPVFDCGLIAENIMLLATRYGLGTIAQAQAVRHPTVVRQLLGIPQSKLLLLGIAIGYPDWDNPMNTVRSERDPVDAVATWHGFD